MERPKANTFLIRGLQYTTVVERMFYASNKEEREEWIKAIESIAERLQVLDGGMEAEETAATHSKKKKVGAEAGRNVAASPTSSLRRFVLRKRVLSTRGMIFHHLPIVC